MLSGAEVSSSVCAACSGILYVKHGALYSSFNGNIMCMYCIDGTHLLYMVVCKSEHVQNAFYMHGKLSRSWWLGCFYSSLGFLYNQKINALSPCVNWCYIAGIQIIAVI